MERAGRGGAGCKPEPGGGFRPRVGAESPSSAGAEASFTPSSPSPPTSCFSSCLDLLWATWLECIWPRTTTCQTWLKNLKKLKRTWKPRRSPLVPDAHLALYSGPTNSVPGPAFLTATSKAVFLFGLRACALPQI